MGGLEAGWEAGVKHNELSANSVLHNKVTWESASHKMLILCFEKQILSLFWDILKWQFLKVTEFLEKLCLKADWGAEMLTWVLHFFPPHSWPYGRWGPGPVWALVAAEVKYSTSSQRRSISKALSLGTCSTRPSGQQRMVEPRDRRRAGPRMTV